MTLKKPHVIIVFVFLFITASCGSEEDEDQPVSQSKSETIIQNSTSPTTNPMPDTAVKLNLPFAGYQIGDIIFQTTSGMLTLPLQKATGSNFTHCGLVAVGKNGNTFVIEAFDSVMRTPINDWIKRGEEGKYAVLRLKNTQLLNESAQVKLKFQAKSFLGLPYDSKYGWGDDKLYCSELVYKLMYASGVTLCKLSPLRSYNLNSDPVKKALQQVYGNAIPYDELMVSPADIYESELLTIIYSN